MNEGAIREVTNRVQRLRKFMKLSPNDSVDICYQSESAKFVGCSEVLVTQGKVIVEGKSHFTWCQFLVVVVVYFVVVRICEPVARKTVSSCFGMWHGFGGRLLNAGMLRCLVTIGMYKQTRRMLGGGEKQNFSLFENFLRNQRYVVANDFTPLKIYSAR